MVLTSLGLLLWLSALLYGQTEDLPRTTVIRSSPQRAVYPGHTVTLQCVISEYNDWRYKWFRDGQPLTNENKKTITLHADAASSYTCEGSRTDRPTKSQLSDPHTVTITALPTAGLTISPNPAYSGETVTLTCTVRPGSGWRYRWFRDNREITESQSAVSTITAGVSVQGRYYCQGNKYSRPTTSTPSNFRELSVTVNKPAAIVGSDKTAVFTGHKVTLTCSFGESSGWRFYWYRHSTGSNPVSVSTKGLYTFTPSCVSEGGEFWCRGGRGDPVYYTEYSQPISINVSARPYAVLTLKPNWTQIYIGETVTLYCEIKGTEDFTNWKYTWYKTGTSMKPSSTTEFEYKFSPKGTTMSDFTCKGVRDLGQSETSEPLTLTVSGKLQPVLRVSPSWLNPGDSVTLTCEIEGSSTDWRFFWYRTVPYKAERPSLSDQSYSVEPLLDSDHGTGESSYILHGATHTAGYVCRAGRGQPVYHSDDSEPQFLWSGDKHPSVSLTVNTNRAQHFTSETVSLSCEGNFTGWKVKWNTTNELLKCPYQLESTCSLSRSNTEHRGVYWCESGSGEYSNAVNITLTLGNVILESLVHPVTEGDSVTLRCKHRNPSPNSKADFYKDGGLIQNGTSGQMTIPAVSKSDEGLYRCRFSDGEESPESWLVVRVVSSLLQRRLLFVLLVASPYLLATILLVMIHCQHRAKCPAEGQPDYDDVGEDPETPPPAVAGPSSAL